MLELPPDNCRVHIHRDPFSYTGHRLFIYHDTNRQKSGGRIVECAMGFQWEEKLEGEMWVATDGIGHADKLIQQIVDKAWEAGFRPSGFLDIKNETAALRSHLADMKQIAFHTLKIPHGGGS